MKYMQKLEIKVRGEAVLWRGHTRARPCLRLELNRIYKGTRVHVRAPAQLRGTDNQTRTAPRARSFTRCRRLINVFGGHMLNLTLRMCELARFLAGRRIGM